MNQKFILFIGICLVASLAALHFRQSNSISTSGGTPEHASAAVPAEVPAVYFQPRAAVNLDKNASPAPAVAQAQAQTNRNDDLNTKLEKRCELMAHLRDWAARDLAGALAFVSNMPEGDERDEAVQAVCFGLAQKDPAHAVELAQSLQEPGAVVENLAQQWAGSDLPSTLVWANNQPAGDERDQLFQRVTLVLSQNDPSDAASLVMEQIPPGPAQDEAIMTVVNQWGNQNLAAAASWVKNFPDGPLQKRAVEELEGIEHYRQELARQ